jgi:hypothetical protein
MAAVLYAEINVLKKPARVRNLTGLARFLRTPPPPPHTQACSGLNLLYRQNQNIMLRSPGIGDSANSSPGDVYSAFAISCPAFRGGEQCGRSMRV